MRRHQFLILLPLLALLVGGTVAWPLVGRAQSPNIPVIGFLNIGSQRSFAAFLAAFHQGLNAAGYTEGRNVAIDYRWADGDFNLLREQAADLVRRQVTLIVATGGLVVARAAKDATDTIPILFIGGGYPVDEGLVSSHNRPVGNATGVNLYASELIPKRLELLHEMVPKTGKFAASKKRRDERFRAVSGRPVASIPAPRSVPTTARHRYLRVSGSIDSMSSSVGSIIECL